MAAGPASPARSMAEVGAEPRSDRARAHPRVRVAVVLLLPVILVAAVEAGGMAAVNGAANEAGSLRGQGAYAQAIAEYQAVAMRGGLVYLAARGRIDDARLQAQRTLLDWAAALAAQGHVDEALEMAGRVSDPAVTGDAQRLRASIALDDAQRQEAAGKAAAALVRLDQAVAGTPPPDLAGEAAQLRPGYALAAAREQLAGGNPEGAVTALDLVAQLVPGSDGAAAAQSLLPAALLAAAQQALAAGDPSTALGELTRLTSRYAATTEGASARKLLATPQRVIGTLVHRDGKPAASVRVRLGSNYRRSGNGFLTSPPYYYARSDANGDFSFDAVPVGSTLTFEFIDQGSWTVLETDGATPDQRQPVYVVSVTALTPVDLAFVRLP